MVDKPDHARRLLRWYDTARRALPWRAAPGVQPDPYHVWLSEIMLQQTVVKTVIPYFEKFLQKWQHIDALAKSDLDDVLSLWAGLGYYARARNLHACAKTIVTDHGGRFPESEKQLLALPGIGSYTAAAIAAIAFDQPATVVDGNVERVIARLFALKTPLPAVKTEIRKHAGELTPVKRPGDYAQAMMDLGATVCTPKQPSCRVCPLQNNCRAVALGIAAQLPYRTKKPAKPRRKGVVFFVLREDGHILLRRRPERGLLARMMEVPGSDWTGEGTTAELARAIAPVEADWSALSEGVTHIFTHFHLQLEVMSARVGVNVKLTAAADPPRCRWVPRTQLDAQALPSVMRKVIAQGLRG